MMSKSDTFLRRQIPKPENKYIKKTQLTGPSVPPSYKNLITYFNNTRFLYKIEGKGNTVI